MKRVWALTEAHESDRHDERDSATLTNREWEITRLVAEGLSDNEIADCLSISPSTVHNHLMNVHRKLRLHKRLELILWYQRCGVQDESSGK